MKHKAIKQISQESNAFLKPSFCSEKNKQQYDNNVWINPGLFGCKELFPSYS